MGLTSLRPGSSKDKELKSTKKFDKKVQFYTKVKDTVASLSASKAIGKKKKLRSRQKKLKAYDLSSLTDFLPEVKDKVQLPERIAKVNCKTRQKLVEKESKQLTAVLNHPAFQSDPLAAIYQHLESTQPVIIEETTKKSSKTGKKKKKKGKKSESSSEVQSMDM